MIIRTVLEPVTSTQTCKGWLERILALPILSWRIDGIANCLNQMLSGPCLPLAVLAGEGIHGRLILYVHLGCYCEF